MRFLVGLALLVTGCIDRPIEAFADLQAVTDLVVLADLGVGCTAQNYLSRDSFEVAAGGVGACLQEPSLPICTRVHDLVEDSLTVSNLDQGVGTLRFVYTANSDGTHELVGQGTPDVTPAPGDTVLAAQHVPATVPLEDALLGFYTVDGPTAFACRFTP